MQHGLVINGANFFLLKKKKICFFHENTVLIVFLASIVTICLPIGSFIVGPLMDHFGRRKMALLTCIPFFIGWILMYLAKNVLFIYAARTIAGIGAGSYHLEIVFQFERQATRL